MRIAISGAPVAPPASAAQRCEPAAGGWVCDIIAGADGSLPGTATPAEDDLGSTVTVPTDARAVRELAHDIAGEAPTPEEQVRRLLAWIHNHIERAPVDSFSALDVLQTRQAECQGHAYLYTAFARSLGIPTRVVSGLVYSEQFKGFLYHSWSISFVNGRWLAVDPTFSQIEADATHITVTEGDSAAELLPLIEWVGKVRIRVLETEPVATRR
jgi:transglutaminase-like putative cysteine protease